MLYAGEIDFNPEQPPLLDAAIYDQVRNPIPSAAPETEIVRIETIPRQLMWRIATTTAVVAIGGALLVSWILGRGDVVQQVAQAPDFGGPDSGLDFTGESLDVQSVLSRVQPSVVTIETGRESVNAVFSGTGTGVVISEDGLILTNAHVINGADNIIIRFFDGTEAEATLLGSFPDDDIALVQARRVTGTTSALLGSSESVRVGDQVVAIGNALGLGGTPSVTLGIISAKGRSIDAGIVNLIDLLQTDAAINPGNSGGPLVNGAGEVIGINTAIIENAQSIGFAISIDSVKPLIEQIRSGNGDITPDTAFLGVTTQSIDAMSTEARSRAGIDTETGALVVDVVAASAAANAGIAIGDVIVAIGDEVIDSPEDVARIVRGHAPDEEIVVTVERSGTVQEVAVTLGARGD